MAASSPPGEYDREADARPHVVVIGSGLVGACTAMWLASSGAYRVTTLERNRETAAATSKANAGRFCPTVMFDYAPKLSSLKSLVWKDKSGTGGGGGAPGVSGISWSVGVATWGVSYLRSATYKQNQVAESMRILARLSAAATDHVLNKIAPSPVDREELSVFPQNLWVFGDAAGRDAAKRVLELGGDAVGASRVVESRERCAEIVSALRDGAALSAPGAGCALMEGDFSADARTFAQRVAKLAETYPGCRTRYGVTVERIVRQGGRLAVDLRSGECVEADRVIVAGGPWSTKLVESSFGMKLPILPVRGCSVDLLGVEGGPSIAVADQTSGFLSFQATPMRGGAVRLVGFADVLDTPASLDSSDVIECPSHYREALVNRARGVFPQMAWKSEAAPWCGLRPMTPDRLPICGPLDPARWPGVYLNVGHGAMGWTLAASTGYLVANRVLRDDGLRSLPSLRPEDHTAVPRLVPDDDESLTLRRFAWW